MDYCLRSLHTPKLESSTFCLADRSSECDDRKEERKEIIDFSSFFTRVKGILECNEEINRIAKMEANRNEFEKHVNVVVRDAKILLVDIRQNAEIKSQRMKHTPYVDEILKTVKVIAH